MGAEPGATASPPTLYSNLRLSLSPQFAHLSDSDLEAAFESAFGEGVSPAEYEEFFGGLGRAISGVASDVGRFAQRAAPVVASVGSGALQGAMAGSALGPWGALGGAIAGGVGSGLAQHGSGAARQVGQVMGGVLNTAGALTGRGAAAGGAGGLLGSLLGRGGAGALGGGAAGQLLGLLQRPETLNALRALAGGSGRSIPVGGSGVNVPAGNLLGLLGALTREAEAESVTFGENEPGAAIDWQPAQLWQLLNSVPPLTLTAPPWTAAQGRRMSEGSADAEETFYFEVDASDAFEDGAFEDEFGEDDALSWRW